MVKDPSRLDHRKSDHIRIALDHEGRYTGSPLFECVTLIPRPLSGLGLQDISLAQKYFGKDLAAPILIDALTGGTEDATKINSRLAKAAEKYHVAFGVGSQRVDLRRARLHASFRCIRQEAPTALVIGNIGFAQLESRSNFEPISQLVSQIEADAISVHINPLQELVQLDGDRHFKVDLATIAEFKDAIGVPVVLKGTGTGFAKEFVAHAVNRGLQNFNLGGYGGTNFALIESSRAQEAENDFFEHVGETFSTWGIPTAASILETKPFVPDSGLLIAGGGIRTGLDIAKAVNLGGDIAGIAYEFLARAAESQEAVDHYLDQLIYELKATMLLAGTKTPSELQQAPRVLLPPLENWVRQRVNDPL